jgi:peptide/nickel transport system substrate-binding protein
MRSEVAAVAVAGIAMAIAVVPGSVRAEEATFRYAEDKPPSTLNPMFAHSMVDVRLEELMFDGLFTYDSHLKPKLALAAKCISANDASCDRPSSFANVTLRQAMWHDGKQVTSADVEFTVKALQDPKTGASEAASVSCIDKVEVKSPTEMKLSFKREQPDPGQCLMFKILPKHKFPATLPVPRAHEFRIRPVGSGAYKLSRWEGTMLELSHADPSAQLKVLQARFIPDKKVQLDFLQYDALEAIVKILPNHRSVIEGMGSKVELLPYASQSWWYLGVNHKNPHLAKRSVREALARAIDREDLRKTFLGEGYTISGPFAPVSPYYNDAVLPYGYDLAQSAKIMQQEKYARGAKGPFAVGNNKVQLRLAVNKDWAQYKDVCLTLQNKLKQAGFDVELDWVEAASWKEKIIDKRDFDLTIGIWSFDDSSDVYPIFHSKGSDNYFGYSNPAMDAMLDESRKTLDPELFRSIYREVHRMAHDDQPSIFLWSVNSYAAISSKVSGVDVHPFRFFTWVRAWKWKG